MNTERFSARRRSARLALVAATVALAGAACSHTPTSAPAVRGGQCNAQGLSWAIGQPLDEATGRRLFKESGAGLWRVIAPQNTFSEDRRDDRLNVRVDSANVVVALDCG